jgi:hypothetical protein
LAIALASTQQLGLKFMERSAARATIAALFFSCCPFTIIRSIRAVIINAVEAVAKRWTFANISKEVFETSPLVPSRIMALQQE